MPSKAQCILLSVYLLIVCVSLNDAKDFVEGTRVNNLLISTEKVFYKGLLFIRRDKDYAYIDPQHRIIKGIIARDLSRTEGEVSVTAGGVGSDHVTLHFKSERGEPINFLVLIFTNNS